MSSSSRVVVLGASGLVGSALAEFWSPDAELVTPSHAALDVLDTDALAEFMTQVHADCVVNLIAWADVDGAEPQRGDTNGSAYRLNVDYPRRLAELCEQQRKFLLHVSTDYVFDGTKSDVPYVEDDPTRALCWYAATKLQGEVAVLRSNPAACVARIEMPFTGRAHRKSDLARTFAGRLQKGQPIQGVTDQRITPLFLDDGAAALRALVEARHAGVIHVAATDWTTPHELAHGIAERTRLPKELIQAETFERFSTTRPAQRPRHSWLDVSRFTDLYGTGILKCVEDELDAWVAQWQSK